MDNLDFLDGETPVEPTAAPTPAETPPETVAPEPTEGPQRGPDGKFISKAAEPAQAASTPEPETPAVTPEAAPQAPVAPEGYVPVGALQALRDEMKQLKQQARQPPPPAPDPYEDFEAYQAWSENQITMERANWSRQLAEAKYGAEIVTQAQQWAAERFDTDPIFAQQSRSSPDPFGFAIDQYQRDQALTLLADPQNRDKFMAFLSGQAAAPTAAPMATVTPSQAPTPPRSLASASSAGGIKPGETPVGPGVAFDSIFKD